MISLYIIKLRYLIALAFACTLSTASWGGCQERKDDQREISSLLNDAEDNNHLFLDYLIDENDMEEDYDIHAVVPFNLENPAGQRHQPLFAPMTPELLAQLGLTPCTYAYVVEAFNALYRVFSRILELVYIEMNSEEDGFDCDNLEAINAELLKIDTFTQILPGQLNRIFNNLAYSYNRALHLAGEPEIDVRNLALVGHYPLLQTLHALRFNIGELRSRGLAFQRRFAALYDDGDLNIDDMADLEVVINRERLYVYTVLQDFDRAAVNQHEDDHENLDDCDLEIINYQDDINIFQPQQNVTTPDNGRPRLSPAATPSPVAPRSNVTPVRTIFGNGGGSASV